MLTQGGQISTIRLDSPIAQLVEQRTVNPCVPGSSPGWGAKFEGQIRNEPGLFCCFNALTRSLWLVHSLILFFICVCFPHLPMCYQAQIGAPYSKSQTFTSLAFLCLK